MTDWDALFDEEAHVLRQPDIFAVHFARILQGQEAKRVLDWGCGAGRHVIYLAAQGFEVTGMDPAATGIETAERWLASEGLEAKLHVAEPGQIPAGSASFDAVLSLYAIEHGSRDEVWESVKEIHRVLRPGGFALITLSSGEDSMKHYGRPVDAGTYVPQQGPEAGIPHYLTTRDDVDDFFGACEVLELTHVCSRLSALEGDDRVDAHWVVITRKPDGQHQ